MADDMAKGIIDRFRSLPMARSAVLTGRSFADVIYNAGILVVLMAPASSSAGGSTPVPGSSPASGCCSLFAFAMAWIGIWLGLLCPRSRSASRSLHGHLPHHVHLQRVRAHPALPTWLQPIAEWNPVSTLTASLRELWGNPNPFATDNLAQQPILVTLGWVVVFVSFVPLWVRKFQALSR